jgi:hypothetical protein
LNDRDNLGKFDAKSDEGIFLGYSLNSKAYRVFNKRTMVVDKSMHVVFYETNPFHIKNNYDDELISLDNKASSSNQVDSSENIKDQVDEPQDEEKALPLTKNEELPKSWNVIHSHPKELIIGEVERGVSTRSKLKNICNSMAFLSQIEPKNINGAIEDELWILAMQEELNQFERNKVWTLAPRPKDHSVIGTKWVFRNKKDEEGIIVRNKARLVAQDYNQEEDIDYGETYAPVARLEAIRMLLTFACFKNFKLFQMDVKSAFLNGFIAEEVYVEQPPGFENHEFPNHVFKLSKALYGLKQAPRAWYERLSGFFIEKGFTRGKLDTTLFLMLIVQIYVDDIIFGSTNENLCKELSKTMQDEFEMSMMGELKFFLGLQIKQTEEGIFLNQSKYVIDLLKRFGLANAKAYGIPMSPSIKFDKDEKGKPVDVKLYRGMIGSLLYLTASRPDIMFSVCLCARFQSCPKKSHLIAVKRIF